MILSRTTFHLVRVKWNSSDFKDYVGSMWGPVGQAETRKPALQAGCGTVGLVGTDIRVYIRILLFFPIHRLFTYRILARKGKSSF
jgi:hypothetical protein